jgi:DNA-binding response OmpR family regulator
VSAEVLLAQGMMVTMATAVPKVLVVDDDSTVREVVSRYLVREGYRVEESSDGADALRRALADPPELVVLDLMLPSLDGLEVCRQLRLTAPIPVIMLTARDEEGDRIAGLELGADDYVAKPFSPRELAARVKAVLRRTSGPLSPAQPDAPNLEAGDVIVDTLAHSASVRGEPVALTVREYDLLVHLMQHPHRAFRREELLADVWGFEYGDASTVTVHVRRLREKIEKDPGAPRYICTVWGYGYRFEP